MKAPTKNEGATHTIVCDPLVMKAFELDLADRKRRQREAGAAWKDSGAFFVTRFGGRVDARADWEEWQDILRQAGLPPIRVHDLRHTAATNMQVSDVAFDASFDRFWDYCAVTDWVSASWPVFVSLPTRHAVA